MYLMSQSPLSQSLQEELSDHLRAMALCHNVNLSSKLAHRISGSLSCDIRQAFNYLQLWLCWSPSNHPMLPSNDRMDKCTLPYSTELCCEMDVLSRAQSNNNWWSVEPMDSLCDHPRHTQHCDGVTHVWEELARKVTSYTTSPSSR